MGESPFPEIFKLFCLEKRIRRCSDPWLWWFSWAKHSVGVFTRGDIHPHSISIWHWQLSLNFLFKMSQMQNTSNSIFDLRIVYTIGIKITLSSTRHLSRPASSIHESACRLGVPTISHPTEYGTASLARRGRCTLLRRLSITLLDRSTLSFPPPCTG